MSDNVKLIEPVGCPDMQMAMGGAGSMLAGYWGVQEGDCVYEVPCGALGGWMGTGGRGLWRMGGMCWLVRIKRRLLRWQMNLSLKESRGMFLGAGMRVRGLWR